MAHKYFFHKPILCGVKIISSVSKYSAHSFNLNDQALKDFFYKLAHVNDLVHIQYFHLNGHS